MLMKFPISPSVFRGLAARLEAVGRLWFSISQIHRAMKHRREIAALADQDDYLLADIGLTRDDLRRAIAQPFWRDPTESWGSTPRQRSARPRPSVSPRPMTASAARSRHAMTATPAM